MITDSIVEEIKARVDLADLISSYGIQVRTAGASKKACCPFHHEKTPSFNINETKGFYHCFGCGESGDAIKFVMKMDGLTFAEAVRKLADQCGIQIVEKEDPDAIRRKRLYSLLAELAQFYHRCLIKTREAEIARKYLDTRELGETIQSEYLIGYAPNGVSTILKWAEKYHYFVEELEAAGVIIAPKSANDRGYHRFSGRLIFSIRDKQGRVVGFSGRQLVEHKNSGKYVNSPETMVFKKSNILYGFDKASSAITRAPHREAIVCEGQIDCIRLQTSGFPNAVAGQGTAFTDEHVRMLKKSADQVVLVYDDDAAGHKATIKSARLCLAAELPVRVVSLPGGDDPDSFLRSHSSDEFRRMIDGAESIMAFQVRTERDKETTPNSIEAVRRISREVLTTIRECPSAILRVAMMDEAAKLLQLPRAALQEELDKMSFANRAEPIVPKTEESSELEVDESNGDEILAEDFLDGESAKTAIPPPKVEMAFLEFLLAHEQSEDAHKIAGLIGEFLPSKVFSHPFSWAFLDAWRMQIASEEDLLGPWCDKLSPSDRNIFDAIMLNQYRACESTMASEEVAQSFIRSLWVEHLKRIRGELPAVGDSEADLKRMKITLDLKRLNSVKWTTVKALIREWIR